MFLCNQDEFGISLCCRQAQQNIGGNSHMGRYSKGQISVDQYIGWSLATWPKALKHRFYGDRVITIV